MGFPLTIAAIVALAALCAYCYRAGAWHRQEAAFWNHIAVLSTVDLAPRNAPHLLAWAKANPPTLVEQMRRWAPPADRRKRALLGVC